MKKLFAKLHLWLAIPFGIIITVLCLSGAILVFEDEIKELTQPSLYRASKTSTERLSFEELMRAVESQIPDSVTISSIQVLPCDRKNYALGVAGQRRTSLIVDPYTGEVKGKVQPYAKGSFFSFVRKLHRWFLFEMKREGISWGKMITGTSTLIFVFIIISGIIIWIPRTWKGVKKRLSIKTGAGRFRFWYDFHLAGGNLASILLLTMTLTGLTWSFNWYRNGFYKVFGVEVVQNPPHNNSAQSSAQAGNGAYAGRGDESSGTARRGIDAMIQDSLSFDTGAEESIASAASGTDHTNTPDAGRGKGRRGNMDHAERDQAVYEHRGSGDAGPENRAERNQHLFEARKYQIWEQALNEVANANPGFRSVTVQDGTISVAISNYGNTRASDVYSFDPATGIINDVKYYRDQPRSSKIRGWIYAVHVGSWGGLTTKILYFIACIIGAALPLTGYYIWLKKRWKKWGKKWA